MFLKYSSCRSPVEVRTLHLSKDMNDHMVDSFSSNVLTFCQKKNWFIKNATLPQNGHVMISLPLFGYYDM